MQIKRYETKEDWELDRVGRITGSKLKGLITKRGTSKKIGFWKLVADRLAIPDSVEINPMERGIELEEFAIKKFEKQTGKKVDASLVMWQRDENDNIAISPDGYTKDLKEAIEVKCLGSAYHIEALFTQVVPKNYEDQILQYFIVNDELERLYMVFYDPRLLCKQFFYLTVERDQKKVEEYLELERQMLLEINDIVKELSEL